jgi:polyhydroxybutyrate depolymerase
MLFYQISIFRLCKNSFWGLVLLLLVFSGCQAHNDYSPNNVLPEPVLPTSTAFSPTSSNTPLPAPPTPTPTSTRTPIPATPTASPQPSPLPTLTVKLKTYTLKIDEIDRKFKVYLPPKSNSEQRFPLLIMFHGRGQSASQIAKNTASHIKAAHEGYIAVFPEASGSPSSWNPGFRTWDNYNVDDLAFSEEVLNFCLKNFPVDPSRIYLAGFSSGGVMAYASGARLSRKIAAIGVVAGTIGVRQNDGEDYQISSLKSPVSVIFFHGTLDASVPYKGYEDNNIFFSVKRSLDFWVSQNQCLQKPTKESLDDGKKILTTYSNCAGGTSIKFFKIINGEHSWPGGSQIYSETFSATNLMFEFFKQHKKSS